MSRAKHNSERRTLGVLSHAEKLDLKMFGERVAIARKTLRMKQGDMIDFLFEKDVNVGRVCDIEKGQLLIDVLMLKRLCVFLNVCPSYLLGLSSEPDLGFKHQAVSQVYHNVTQHIAEQVAELTQAVTERAIQYMEQSPDKPEIIRLVDVVKSVINQNDITENAKKQLSQAVRDYEVIQARRQIDAFKFLDDMIDEQQHSFADKMKQEKIKKTGVLENQLPLF